MWERSDGQESRRERDSRWNRKAPRCMVVIESSVNGESRLTSRRWCRNISEFSRMRGPNNDDRMPQTGHSFASPSFGPLRAPILR